MPKKGDKVYKRKDGLWEARYVKEIGDDGRKKYGSVYARTCSEAKDKRQAAVDGILLYGGTVGARNITVGRLVLEWIHLNRARIKPSSLQKYTTFWTKHIKPHLGNRPVISCGTVFLHEYAKKRVDEGLSEVTVNAILSFLHSCFKLGNRQYKLPIPDFVYFPRGKKEMRVLSRVEQSELEKYLIMQTDIYKFGVLLALYTGLRVGELCALRWSDFDSGCIKVQATMQRLARVGGGSEVVIGTPKTPSSARVIPLPPFICDLAERFRPDLPDRHVLSTPEHAVVEPRVMQYRFARYMRDLGIEGATFHTLRHSFATRCVDKYNFEIKTLSEILGHSSVEMTLNRYVHSSMELKKASMEKLQLLS